MIPAPNRALTLAAYARKSPRMTPELIAKMRRMRAEGVTFWDIGFRLGVSASTVSLHTKDVARDPA